MSSEAHAYRTRLCHEIRATDIGQQVRLAGWVHNIRDLGGITFFELRDNYGITQLLIQPESPAAAVAEGIRKEFCISVIGTVQSRGEDNFNAELETGEVDLAVTEIEILGAAESLPFSVFPDTDVSEELRLKYRYLDLRRHALHQNILLRTKVISAFRNKMVSLGFNEITTPILTSSSPEGARDFVVPSRVYPGKFYALPQAPQQFKQLLMVAGFDKYFQIAPCFRDEDARADRSPGEFYQLDIEMSFVTQEDIFSTLEDVMTDVFGQFVPGDAITAAPFPRIAYRDAMLLYGSDKPDLRNPLFIQDVSEVFEKSEFRAFAGKPVRVIKVPDALSKPRSFFDKVDLGVKEKGGAGASWILLEDAGAIKGPLAKFVTEEQAAQLIQATEAKPGDGIFFYSSQDMRQLENIMGYLRDHLGSELGLIEKGEYKFCWITDIPMYERDIRTGKIDFCHNPFSMPQGGMEALESMDPLDILAYQYDIVCNGVELSSGAIRNHRPDIMYKAFALAGYSQEEVDKRFGGMIRAFKVGAPPHGGIAPGIDRIIMLIADQPNLRHVIPFPMSQTGQDLMMGAPSEIRDEQLKELHIELNLPPAGKKAAGGE